MNTWKLRHEILTITHRWYIIAVYFLIGALIGWGGSYLWPSPYRATIDLHLGLNAYRSPYDGYVASVEQQQFRMVDDYKNWQMSHLNDLVLTDDFLLETLRRLREQESDWNDVTPQDFRKTLRGVWRNVGKWHLVAEGKDPIAVNQAVLIWSDVILEWVGEAIEHSKKVVFLDVRMTDVSDTLVNHQIRRDSLQYIRVELLEWQDEIDILPDNQLISSQDHWEITTMVARAADWGFGWDYVLDGAPTIGSSPVEYRLWFDRVIPLVEQELQDLVEEIDNFEHRLAEIETAYNLETEQSRALASTLVIEKPAYVSPQTERVRPTGVMILVGGILGLSVWSFGFFTGISRRTYR